MKKSKKEKSKTSKEHIEFTVTKCKTKAAYSVKPIRNLKLNFNKLKQKKDKYEIIADTPIVLVVKDKINKSGEMIIHNYGEILFKELTDKKKIKKIVKGVYEFTR